MVLEGTSTVNTITSEEASFAEQDKISSGNKTKRNFSCISHDQIHEQNNKLVKLYSTKLSLLSNKDELMKWMTAGPEIARMNSEFEEINNLNQKGTSNAINTTKITNHPKFAFRKMYVI